MLEDMYPMAVEAGISATDYWSMSFDEIMIQVLANRNREQKRLKEKAIFDYAQQRLSIFSFNDPKKFPKFEEAYPFVSEINQKEEATQEPVVNTDQDVFIRNAIAIQQTRERRQKQDRK